MRIKLWPLKVLPAIDEPLHGSDDEYEEERHDAVIHVTPRNLHLRREQEEDGGDDYIGEADQISNPPQPAVDGDGDPVTDAERDDASGDDGVERAAGPQEDAAEDDDQGGSEVQSVEGEVEARVDLCEEAGGGEAAVAREGVGHARGSGHYACCCEEEADEGEAAAC
ncbi:hypothetical protein V501_06964 [Pseudogymnoascus sp. VKM F-4519 (FW-2642)]|nr:hypothetical protein V501_06964 [Pseudogymnoascus sp. VKM F-4519 (FW-2642)]